MSGVFDLRKYRKYHISPCFCKSKKTYLKQIFVRTSTKEEACKWAEYHSPVMIHVPHSSTLVPKEDMKNFIGDELEGELLRMTDHYCDDLFKCKHDMLEFPYSRLVCDVERFKDDKDEPMAAIGMGFADEHRVLVEPACGASLSVVYDNDAILEKYRNIVVIVCGGSKVDLDQIAEWKKA